MSAASGGIVTGGDDVGGCGVVVTSLLFVPVKKMIEDENQRVNKRQMDSE